MTPKVTAFWTPKGLYKFTRLVMGTKNASTAVAQNAFTKAMNTHLNPRSRDKIANFADDFCGGADTLIPEYKSLRTLYKVPQSRYNT